MKWNVGHGKKPQDRWPAGNQNGYDWDDEGIDDFTYETVEDTGDFDGEPEYMDLGEEYAGTPHYGASEEYAQDEEYMADQDYNTGSLDYAFDPAYDLNNDFLAGDANSNHTSGEYDGYDENGYVQGEEEYAPLPSYEETEYVRESEGYEEYDQNSYTSESYEESNEEGYDANAYDENGYAQDGYDQNYDQGYVDKDIIEEMAMQGGATTTWNRQEVRREATRRENTAGRGQVYSWEDRQTGGSVYKQAEPEPEYDEVDEVSDENEFQGEITYIDDYNDRKPQPSYARAQRAKRVEEERGGFGAMDGIIAAVGIIAIVGLLGFIMWFVSTHKTPEDPHLQFANVGQKLQTIELIGGKGIMAVANAEIARLTPVVDDPIDDPDQGQQQQGGYDEKDYTNTIAVAMSLTSVQKDLKIKFSNRETSKLVGNVRFVALVTKPDGSVEEWEDDDMDGIIYEKGIDAGKYSVSLKTLTDDKYNNLILPASAQTVNVKKNIEYTKVDVSGEGKKESEINVNQEDTKKNETTVEGALTDTVTWVASSMTGNTYTEVLKSSIPDPLTVPITVAKAFLRTAEVGGETGNTDPVLYNVTYDANGGTGSMAGEQVPAGGYTPKTCTFEAPAGKEFDHWEFDGVITGDTVIKAIWRDKPATKFTISFAKGNEAAGGSMDSVQVDAGTSYPLPACGFTAPEGMEFDGWEQGAVGTPISITGDTTFTAKWKQKAATSFKVTFAKGDDAAAGTMETLTVTDPSNFKLPPCTFTAPVDKVFDKWDKGEAGASYPLTADTTLTAQWKTKTSFKVTFAKGDDAATGTMDAVTVTDPSNYKLPPCTFTAPTGKIFDKWDKGEAGASYPLTTDITLTAQWKASNVAPLTIKLNDKTDDLKVALKISKYSDGSTKNQASTVTVKVEGTTKNTTWQAISGDSNIVKAAADTSDPSKLILTAVAKGTVKVRVVADYADAADKLPDGKSQVVKEIEVTVSEKEALSLTLEKTEILCNSDNPNAIPTLEVTIKNSNEKPEDLTEAKMTGFTVQSSDATIANVTKKEFGTASADGTLKIKLTITLASLLEKKSVVLTVNYQEAGFDPVSAKCTLIIKPHPKNDKVTLLKDKDGNQLYVQKDNKEYREAVYADYYVDGTKFFIQGGIKYTGWQTLNGKVYFFDAQGKAVTGEQIIQGAKYTFGADGALISGGVLGIDVSKWNSTIDWKAVKNSGVSFVIIRVGYRGSTKGQLIEDPKFTTNIKGAINAGLKVGVYFFTQAVDEVEAVYEASYVIDKIKNYKISYPVFLDVEASGGRGDKISADTRTKVCKAFCQTIQNAGYTAGVYANKTWLSEKMDASQLSSYKIWLAQYAATPTYDGKYDIWQYKSTGTVSGISGNVDLNLSYMGY